MACQPMGDMLQSDWLCDLSTSAEIIWSQGGQQGFSVPHPPVFVVSKNVSRFLTRWQSTLPLYATHSGSRASFFHCTPINGFLHPHENYPAPAHLCSTDERRAIKTKLSTLGDPGERPGTSPGVSLANSDTGTSATCVLPMSWRLSTPQELRGRLGTSLPLLPQVPVCWLKYNCRVA